MLKLYYSKITEEPVSISESILSPYRREKISKQTNARVREQSVCSELLLRYALNDSGFSVEGPLDLTTGEYGKPFLKSGECFFSLSHSGEVVFCALSDKEIGADVQKRSAENPPLIKRYYSEDEQAYVAQAADRDEAFTEIWTMKESCCKLDGRGLALPLDSFSVFDGQFRSLIWHAVIGDYHFALCSEAINDDLPELNIICPASFLLSP